VERHEPIRDQQGLKDVMLWTGHFFYKTGVWLNDYNPEIIDGWE